jgi:hypothetical protein
MSTEKGIVVVPFHQRIDKAVEEGMDPRDFMEMMMVEYLTAWANGAPLVTISSGGVTIQCLINNPDREQPRVKP